MPLSRRHPPGYPPSLGRWVTSSSTSGKPKKTSPPKKTAKAKPPPPEPTRLLGILASQRPLGAASYPPSLLRLAELADEPIPAVLKALGDKTVKPRALLSHDAKKAKAAPREVLVILTEDLTTAAEDDRLLDVQLRAARTASAPAVDPARLVKGLARPLHAPFKAALDARLEARRLPRGVGALPGRKPLVFLLADAILPPSAEAPLPHAPPRAAKSAPEASPAPAAGGFASRFDAAFAAIDRAAGSTNYVPLRALREALPDVPRATFDAELAALRWARRYSLDPSDGRHHQLSEADREAGVVEAGHLLVYVARRGEA